MPNIYINCLFQIKNATYKTFPAVIDREKVHKNCTILSDVMEAMAEYEPVLIEDQIHFPENAFKHKMDKWRQLEDLALTVPVQIMK